MQGRRQNTAQRMQSLEQQFKAVQTELILMRKYLDALSPTLPVSVEWPHEKENPS